MPAYVIATFEATDAEGMEEYRGRVMPQIAHHGGQFLAHDMPAGEGEEQPHAAVVVEFPSMDEARAWYEAANDQELKALRQRSVRATLHLLDELPVAPLPREFSAG